ncbi:hypothetical protein EIP91_006605 [Steccherinum ochraceum]|uniref:Uncharacterized protein n=1 Tax=Steccherinum ochraceum TaxID=92696 RepID=A0A4R0R5N6_9APHY|nr:hypothetical protein EIP91_006605 [Steccherinum ochraceum]
MLTTFTLLACLASGSVLTALASPTPCHPSSHTAPDPTPIPIPHVTPHAEYALGERRFEKAPPSDLPSPFESHPPTTGVVYPHNVYPWRGMFKTPNYSFPDRVAESQPEPEQEEDPTTTRTSAPFHNPTAVLILNPELKNSPRVHRRSKSHDRSGHFVEGGPELRKARVGLGAGSSKHSPEGGPSLRKARVVPRSDCVYTLAVYDPASDTFVRKTESCEDAVKELNKESRRESPACDGSSGGSVYVYDKSKNEVVRESCQDAFAKLKPLEIEY